MIDTYTFHFRVSPDQNPPPFMPGAQLCMMLRHGAFVTFHHLKPNLEQSPASGAVTAEVEFSGGYPEDAQTSVGWVSDGAFVFLAPNA